MTTKDKPLKARLPRGLADRTAADIRATETDGRDHPRGL